MAKRKYEQRLRAESAEDTRRRILEAVYERLRDAPTQPVSVDQVARMAGVSRSTVYLIFGSRGDLFDAAAADLFERGGFDRVVEAIHDPDPLEHLRGGIRGGVLTFAAHRDVLRVLYSMAELDPDAVGGAIARGEARRAEGMAYLAGRLEEHDLLRPGVSAADAADILWVITSFDGFDQLYTGRKLAADAVADTLVATAERAVLRD